MSNAAGISADVITSVRSRDDRLDLADVRRRVRAIFIGSIGNLVEWYDFYAYAAFALYFAASFFPGRDPVVQQLNAAILFAVGFIMRPIGGWLFGHLADHYGRRRALMLSVLLMCFGSLMIAVTPTYAAIGVAAPALLGLARVIQGLSLGGEYGTSATYLSEVADEKHRGNQHVIPQLTPKKWYRSLGRFVIAHARCIDVGILPVRKIHGDILADVSPAGDIESGIRGFEYCPVQAFTRRYGLSVDGSDLSAGYRNFDHARHSSQSQAVAAKPRHGVINE